MKKSLLILAILFSTTAPALAHAESSELSVTPVVIDEKAKQRDILKETVTLKNTTNRALDIYPSVNNVDAASGEKDFSVARNSEDLSASLANWIELSRGVIVLSPGEERSMPFNIRVNLNAVPGTYHATISLTEGDTRSAADAHPPIGTITVNVEIQADTRELLQLDKFVTGNIFFSGDDVLFKYQLENIGNQELQPKGEIRVYNRNGEEVADVPVNKDAKSISPEETSQLASVWSAANGFGRYKALLTVDYGSSGTASVEDTVFFWIIPWKQMLGMFTASLIILVVLAFYFHQWLERRHFYKFANAGLINEKTMQELEEHVAPKHAPLIPEPLPASIAPLMEVPPKEKKRRFAFFRRAKKPHVHTETPHAPVHEPVAHAHAERHVPEHRHLRDVLRKEPSSHARSHSIDIRQLREHRAHAATHAPAPSHKVVVRGHIVSFKKTV